MLSYTYTYILVGIRFISLRSLHPHLLAPLGWPRRRRSLGSQTWTLPDVPDVAVRRLTFTCRFGRTCECLLPKNHHLTWGEEYRCWVSNILRDRSSVTSNVSIHFLFLGLITLALPPGFGRHAHSSTARVGF